MVHATHPQISEVTASHLHTAMLTLAWKPTLASSSRNWRTVVTSASTGGSSIASRASRAHHASPRSRLAVSLPARAEQQEL